MNPLEGPAVKLLIAAIVLAAVTGAGWLAYNAVERHFQAPVLAQLEAEKAAHEQTRKLKAVCDGVVGAQTKGIEALQKESDKRVAESKAALAAAAKRAAALEKSASDKANSPPLDADECKSMELRAERSIREFQSRQSK